MVVDAFSQAYMGSISNVHQLKRLGVLLEDSSKTGFMISHNFESSLVVDVPY